MSSFAEREHTQFEEASREALQIVPLQTALSRLGDTLAANNRAAWHLMQNSSQIRDLARNIKDDALSRLDELIEQMELAVEQAGGKVHYASDAEAARAIVLDIAERSGTRLIAKSKSMTSEEIHLNSALEQAGYEVVETDLGEYIAQIAKQRPSHLVAPIIHMTRHEVAETLSSKLGRELPSDPGALARAAREELREVFRTADMGITGANFVVAETGTVCIISNEGNARLTSTIPPVHVAIAGIEKVIPSLDDLPVFLKLLARAATGQKMSVYTNLITGPRRGDENDGPREFHLILLDNGRSEILGSKYRESLFCIRCGACLNVCPVYRKVGGHAYGGVYAGPIGAVLTPLYDGLKDYTALPNASSLCGACEQACPVKIAIPEMLIKLREDLAVAPEKSRIERWIYRVWKVAMRSPRLFRFGTWLTSRILGRTQSRWYSKLPGPLAGWTHARDFPAPSRKRFRDHWKNLREAD